MKQIDYVITDELGIHARPAGMIVKLAGTFESAVTIKFGDKKGDAKKIFAVMGLAVKHGNTIIIEIDGPDEDKAAQEIEAFLKENL